MAFAMLLTLSLVACKKDQEELPVPFNVEGVWSGKIGTDPASPGSQFSLNIKPGGFVERINGNGGISGTGTWLYQGTAFSANYILNGNNTKVQLTGTVYPGEKKISGTWSNNGGDTGKWFLNTRDE